MANKINIKKDRIYFWQRIWESEDSHSFGNLAIIVGAILITKFTDSIFTKFNLPEWFYLLIGIIIVLKGVKLLRKYDKSNN